MNIREDEGYPHEVTIECTCFEESRWIASSETSATLAKAADQD
jgi:hypothetical protein